MKGLDDTIAAIATAPGMGAIAIVRASGPGARAVGEDLVRDGEGNRQRLEGRGVRWGRVVTPDGGVVVDEVLLVWMPGPRSYTRQDVLEIQCHGGQAAAGAVLELVLGTGVRLAEPGEFTLRAFLGGRIDLVQAEAVLDTIGAETADALCAHELLLEGRLSAEVSDWQDRLGRILGELEARLDFGEEEVEALDREWVGGALEEVARAMAEKVKTFAWGRVSREGFRVALVGAPNTGKSSLFNRLAEGDHVMVSTVAGTTRDTVEVRINALGVPVRLVDTAGLRGSRDELEAEGIRRALRAAAEADLVLLVFDGSRELQGGEEDEGARLGVGKAVIAVVNKIDLGSLPAARLGEIFGQAPLLVSAQRGDGIPSLLQRIREMAWRGEGKGQGAAPLTRVRHRRCVEEAGRYVDRALEALVGGEFPELVAREIQGARACLRELLGWGTSEEVLQGIFDEFCIGK